MMNKILAIDIETYSSVDLPKCGVYAYADSPDFEILLVAYAYGDDPVQVVDIASGEEMPCELIVDIMNPAVTKTAFNANFERTCLSKHLSEHLVPEGWRCTAVQSYMLALPMSLDGVGEVVGVENKKLKEGVELLRYFAMPCKPTKTNGGRTRNLPKDAPDKWQKFKEYCKRDVEAEREIRSKLHSYPISDSELALYVLDQEINDRGVRVDRKLARNAIECDVLFNEAAKKKAYELTGLENPNSVSQLKSWLGEQGMEVENLGKKNVKAMLDESDGDVLEMLKLRLLLSKTSVKKYQAIERCVCSDGRVHGLLQFYGANRSGRWAGRLVQVQNLPQNHIKDLELARSLVKDGRYEDIELLYDSVPGVLSELIRTTFIPRDGRRFIVADFSAIEARVLAWMAGEPWRLKAFADGEDIYCASASKMFGVPVKKHGVNGELRQKGKVAELACIAEGSLVLTDKGPVPIEKVTLEHRLWDGLEWVKHDGVASRGVRKVISYGGLTATPDHLVILGDGALCLPFAEVAADTKPLSRPCRVYDIRNAGPRHRFIVSGHLVHNCGYGGGVGALKNMGALEMGVPEDELQRLITDWRTANPGIVKFWWDVDSAAIKAVKEHTSTSVGMIGFTFSHGILFVTLPSGRKLAYVKPRLEPNKFGREGLTYEGIGESKKWLRIETYGPKLVENIVQGTSRDLLAQGMLKLRNKGFEIVFHVHDECVCEVPVGESSVEEVCGIMAEAPDWAEGLPLKADGYECQFYKKD